MLLLDAFNSKETVENSIELSKAINDLGALTVMAGVFLALVIVMFGFFIYQLVTQQKQLTSISKAAEATNNYFISKELRAINLDQARSIVSMSFKRMQYMTIAQVCKIIQLSDDENIENRVDLFLANLQKDHRNYLFKFDYNEMTLSTMCDEYWIVEVKNLMLKSIEEKSMDIITLIDDYKTLFDKYSSNFDSKLSDL